MLGYHLSEVYPDCPLVPCVITSLLFILALRRKSFVSRFKYHRALSVPRNSINNRSTLVHLMAWCWTCGKSLTEINDDHLLTYACVTKLRYVYQFIFSFVLFSCWIETGNWRCCKIGFQSETHLRLQFREISFVYYLLFSWQITLKFCTERHSITAVLCVFYKYMI